MSTYLGVLGTNNKIRDVSDSNGYPVKLTDNTVKDQSIQKDFSRFITLHTDPVSSSPLATTASAVYASLPYNVSKVFRTRVFLQSNNNGALIVFYSYEGTNWIATTVTGTLDSVSAKYIYEWTKDAPIVQVKYQYTETAAIGAIYGGVAILEKVVV